MPASSTSPRVRTTTAGPYPVPEWLSALPSEQGVLDATRVVFDTQRQAGVDLPTDGELSRFDVNHPETNGMIDYFVRPMAGTRSELGRSEVDEFRRMQTMGFRAKPAAVVESALGEGALNLLADCERSASVAGGEFKFTLTSPFMLARTLLDRHYGDFESMLMAVADVLADQVRGLPESAAVVQVDEANVPGAPESGPIAAKAINRVLDAVDATREKAVHFCFGNYGGQTIQAGTWKQLTDFLSSLHADHLVLEMARRPESDLEALKEVDPKIGIGLGVIDIKQNPVEAADDVARKIEHAEEVLGEGRVKYVHPDCGFWMLKRSVADRKMAALVAGRDRFLGV